jgi:hypothetical protein
MSVARNTAILVGVLVAAFVGAGLVAFALAEGGSGQAVAEQLTEAAQGISFDLDGDGVAEHSADRDTISSEQAAALADEYVTWEEYESAVWAAFTCTTDAGFEPLAEPHLNASGSRLIYSVGDGTGAGTAILDCAFQHSVLVELTWSRQNKPSAEQLASAEAAMLACLVDAGYPEAEVSAAEHFGVFVGRDEHFSRCLREVSVEYKVGWYAGD